MASEIVPSAKHQNPLSATVTALFDLIRPRCDISLPEAELRLDGQHVVITGASGGLGRAVAQDLSRRGASLTLTGRREPAEFCAHLRAEAREEQTFRALGCEMTDLAEVKALSEKLSAGPPIHCLVLNAGMMASRTRLTPQGFEEMFAVHFAANVVLVRHLLEAGALVAKENEPARVIVVASESHRSSPSLELESLGTPPSYSLFDGMKWYGHSKLLLLTWVLGLARRPLAQKIRVHCLCPGPIASGIAREAPRFVRPLLSPVMRFLFNSPETAAIPVVYFACTPDTGKSGDYLHMRERKAPDARALDQNQQDLLWERTDELLRAWLTEQKNGQPVFGGESS